MSYIADEIIEDYKKRKAFEKKVKVNCKEKKCEECKYDRICTESKKET